MKKIVIIRALFFLFVPLTIIHAEEGMKLSITPPLIKNNVNPGQLWKSSIKLVNNNNQEINAYVQVQDFKSGSENGTVEFLPSLAKRSDSDKSLLSSWIVFEAGPIKIPPQSSVDIPFIIDVPETAGPGGHYVAFLAGTRPLEGETSGSSIKVSSLLGSLLLLNVKGDVKEEGKILSFSSEKQVYEKPDVNFSVRFQNTGNVHIQPQGEIRVYDWFNKDRGYMTLNHETDFGNVLPGGTRKWDFNWKIDDNPLAMGRYRAMLIVGFGQEARQTDNREFYFWVLNFKLIGLVLGVLFVILLIIIYLVRLSIRRAIKRTQEQVDMIAAEMSKTKKRIEVKPEGRQVVDLKQNVQNLIKPLEAVKVEIKPKKTVVKIIFKFFGTILIILLIATGAVIFWNNQKNKTIVQSQKTIEIKEDDVKINELPLESTSTKPIAPAIPLSELKASSSSSVKEEITALEKANINKKDIKIVILNGSGLAGLAAKATEILTQSGYTVGKTGNAKSYNFVITEIKYGQEFKSFADVIADLLATDAKLDEEKDIEGDIVITLGKDFK